MSVKYLSRTELGNPYAYLNSEGGYDEPVQQRAVANAIIDRDLVLRGRVRGCALSKNEIERIVRNLHIDMWRQRAKIFPVADDLNPLQMLDPKLALLSLGYQVVIHESLGQYRTGRDTFEVAGIVDNSKGRVQISRRFDPAIMNFTAAHELGHAILHTGSGLHRDRAMDAWGAGPRDPQEVEADTFAGLFLLPEKQVRIAFKKRFLTQEFRLSEATVFALASGSLTQLQDRCRSRRNLARLLATAQHYNGSHFKSLCELFKVSTEVMAIRLEELDLMYVE